MAAGGEGAAGGLATGVGEVPGAGVAEAAGAGVAAGAGLAEAAGEAVAAGAGLAEAAGEAVAAGAAEGLADGEAEGWGDCASVAPPEAKIIIGTSATMAERKVLIGFILAILHPSPGGRGMSRTRRQSAAIPNTQGLLSSHDRCVMHPCAAEHDPEKWDPVFRKDHAQTET